MGIHDVFRMVCLGTWLHRETTNRMDMRVIVNGKFKVLYQCTLDNFYRRTVVHVPRSSGGRCLNCDNRNTDDRFYKGDFKT